MPYTNFQAFGTLVVAIVALIVARRYYNRTIISKLNDRLFELNKLALQHPEVVKDFFNKKHVGRYFDEQDSTIPRDEKYYKLRGYVFFRLNVYEEAFYATQGPIASRSGNGRAWQRYIKEGMNHDLAKELFNTTPNQYGDAFVCFVQYGNLPKLWGF